MYKARIINYDHIFQFGNALLVIHKLTSITKMPRYSSTYHNDPKNDKIMVDKIGANDNFNHLT